MDYNKEKKVYEIEPERMAEIRSFLGELSCIYNQMQINKERHECLELLYIRLMNVVLAKKTGLI